MYFCKVKNVVELYNFLVTDPSSDPGANVLNVGGWQGPKADACGCSIKDKPTVGEKADVCGCSIQDNNAQYYDKIGYCGMPSCPFFNAMDQSCGNAMCPNLQADIPGVQLGKFPSYFVWNNSAIFFCR